ncbi:MAG: YybH family protein [Candidatus Krumholzibacteriia bacterium]
MRRSTRSGPWPAALAAIWLAGLALPASGRPGADIAPHPDLRTLVAAERAFAAEAAARSVRDAFLSWLDEDALLMNPHATPARPFYAGRPPSAAQLAWEPAFAAVSRSGELGYTTGPWTWRASPGDTVAAWGDYVSIWRRRDDGAWRVAIDLGVSHPRPAGEAPRLGFPADGRFTAAAAAGPADDVRAAAALAELRAVEAAFATRAAADGTAAAYREFADAAIRLCREGAGPRLGLVSALAAVQAGDGPVGSGRVLGCGAARAGDLGYAWGETAAGTDAATFPSTSWVRIWARGPERVWRIVLDIALPVPPEPAGG